MPRSHKIEVSSFFIYYYYSHIHTFTRQTEEGRGHAKEGRERHTSEHN